MKRNFSGVYENAYTMATDLLDPTFNYSVEGEKVTKKGLEAELRNVINNDILGGVSLYKAIRRNPVQLYEIIEEIVDISVVEKVMSCPFVESFVEVRNLALGDKNEFYAEGNMLSAKKIAGNHWDLDRHMLNLGNSFSIPTEWIGIRVYEDLERFLLGITSLETLLDKVYAAINRYIKERLCVTFDGAEAYIVSELKDSGNTEEAFGEHLDYIKAYAGVDQVKIAGSAAALRKLGLIMNEKFVSNSQKEAVAGSGYVTSYMGNQVIEIPQVVVDGNTKISKNKVYILGADVKPIKMVVEGNSLTKMDTTGMANNDMSIDAQVQTKLGFGLVVPNAFGTFEFTN